jgi:hypothetical protein
MSVKLVGIVKHYSSRVKKFAAKNANSNSVADWAGLINTVASVVVAVSGAVVAVTTQKNGIKGVSDTVGAVAGALSAVAGLNNGDE